MTARQWLQEQEPKWERLEALLKRSSHSLSALQPAELRELGLLYRGTVNDLSRVQSVPEFQHLEPYLNNLVQRCHGRVYERPAATWRDVARFFLVDFPRCFRRHWQLIGLAFLVFAIGSVIAIATVHYNPDTETYFLPQGIINQLDRGVLWTDARQAAPSESSFLMTNNIRVAINAFAFGALFGVGTLLLLFHNGLFAFGGPLQVCMEHGMGFRLINFMVAHGVIELTTIFIAGGAGMLIGFSILFPGDLPRWEAVKQKSREALILIMGCFPLLVLAGLIEGLVSLNQQVDTPTRLAVAVMSGIFLIAYLGFSGQKAVHPSSNASRHAK